MGTGLASPGVASDGKTVPGRVPAGRQGTVIKTTSVLQAFFAVTLSASAPAPQPHIPRSIGSACSSGEHRGLHTAETEGGLREGGQKAPRLCLTLAETPRGRGDQTGCEWTLCVTRGLLPPPTRGRKLRLLDLQPVRKAIASRHFLTRSYSL